MAKSVASKLTDAQYALIAQMADEHGMTIGQFLRENVIRQYVERLGGTWPDDSIGDGLKTEWGGRRRGAGRPKIKEL